MPEKTTERLSIEELNQLRRADVSPELMAIVRRDPEAAGVKRNSSRQQVRRALDATAEGGVPSVFDYGGDFFYALRKGKLGEAFIRADIANTRLLLDTFGRDYLIECLIAEEEYAPEGAARYVDEKIDSFGDGLIL